MDSSTAKRQRSTEPSPLHQSSNWHCLCYEFRIATVSIGRMDGGSNAAAQRGAGSTVRGLPLATVLRFRR